jgi:hypothetical protein
MREFHDEKQLLEQLDLLLYELQVNVHRAFSACAFPLFAPLR